MKVFNANKYKFVDVTCFNDEPYYAFECIKEDFSPEVVLVKEARLEIQPKQWLFFDEIQLDEAKKTGNYSQLCVNRMKAYAKLIDLAVNQRNDATVGRV